MNARQGRRNKHKSGQQGSKRPSASTAQRSSKGARPRTSPGAKQSGASSSRSASKTAQKRGSNVRVLRPHSKAHQPKARAKLNYGRVISFAAILYFIVWALYPMTYRLEKADELESLKKQLSGIKKENAELKKQLTYLDSDEYVEQEARSLGLSRADEEVIVVIPQGSKSPPQGKDIERQKQEAGPSGRSLWQRIKGMFTGAL